MPMPSTPTSSPAYTIGVPGRVNCSTAPRCWARRPATLRSRGVSWLSMRFIEACRAGHGIAPLKDSIARTIWAPP